MSAEKPIDQEKLGADEIRITGADKSYFGVAMRATFIVYPSAETESVETVRSMSRPGAIIGIEAALEGLELMGVISDSFDKDRFLSTLNETWSKRNEGAEQALADEFRRMREARSSLGS
jgi:hypothetical protein